MLAYTTNPRVTNDDRVDFRDQWNQAALAFTGLNRDQRTALHSGLNVKVMDSFARVGARKPDQNTGQSSVCV